MAKASGRKKAGACKAIPPMVRGDNEGPCNQLEGDLAALAGQLGPLLTLMSNPPTVPSFPVFTPATGVWSWEPV